ncbi:MAG: hypothetical protein AAB317_01790 [Nitrospirota bacterium]
MKKETQQLIAFGFGVIFIVTMLILAIVFPNPTPFQYNTFRLVLSLAAAGVAAMIPGFIQVDLPNWMKAGGGLAVFVIVYFYNPASLVAPTAKNASPPAVAATSPEPKVEENRSDTPDMEGAVKAAVHLDGAQAALEAQYRVQGAQVHLDLKLVKAGTGGVLSSAKASMDKALIPTGLQLIPPHTDFVVPPKVDAGKIRLDNGLTVLQEALLDVIVKLRAHGQKVSYGEANVVITTVKE